MNDIERLLAIEDIKKLKAKYLYGADHQDWALWRNEVWSADGRLEMPDLNLTIEPTDAIIDFLTSAGTPGEISIHHGHMPIIELTSDTTATGIWSLEARIYRPDDRPLNGGLSSIFTWGHYHEAYVKLDVGWRVRSTKLVQVRAEYT